MRTRLIALALLVSAVILIAEKQFEAIVERAVRQGVAERVD